MKLHLRLRKLLQFGIPVAIAAIYFLIQSPLAQAQPNLWSSPSLILATEGDLASSAMTMVADQAGRLHLFFPHRPEADLPAGIDYLYWDDGFWLGPYSVIINDDNSNVSNVRAAIDTDQRIHVIWGGGLNKLYYASVMAADASNAAKWTSPSVLGTAITQAGIAIDSDGTLIVAFADAASVGTISVVTSVNKGTTWSMASVAAITPIGIAPADVSVAVDGADRLHLTWTGGTLPSGDPLVGVFYARSLDRGLTWSYPLQIDGERHGELGVGTVGEDEVHLVWRSNIGGDGTFHQYSGDGGENWSVPNQHNDGGGQSGLPSFGVDSAGRLHYVIGPAFVTSWENGILEPYLDVAGPELRTGLNQRPGWTHPERTTIAITSGNHLHVVFETGFRELWHTSKLTNAPTLPPIDPSPTVIALQQVQDPSPVNSVLEPSLEPTRVATFDHTALPPPAANILLPYIGTGIVGIMLLGLIIFKARKQL
jgi:hypothetical protein